MLLYQLLPKVCFFLPLRRVYIPLHVSEFLSQLVSMFHPHSVADADALQANGYHPLPSVDPAAEQPPGKSGHAMLTLIQLSKLPVSV